jgi:cell division inhibitor SepF
VIAMSAMRKAMQYLGFDVSSHDDYDYDYADEELAPVTNIHDVHEMRESRSTRTGSVRQARPASASDLRRIQTVKPRSYNDAPLIGKAFRQGVPVIMNLTEMTDAEAKRMVDFAVGLSYGLHGTIERVTTAVFLLSPAHVEIAVDTDHSASDQTFFNQS